MAANSLSMHGEPCYTSSPTSLPWNTCPLTLTINSELDTFRQYVLAESHPGGESGTGGSRIGREVITNE
ncbi:hypothetical protein E2C01_066644 [Portunus trituberculatus]|uniref:Uncharacterized protein n=1 Tax=Portunus trituberculatus TaxID=210409 RepID=A0A5B7HHN9_PORTR|nr:hypothetical protein [Portunus trituberculatus]